MPKIKANGINIYYETHGRGEPLVLIMGLRRNAEWWYCQVPALSEHFQVVVFDNRGAGRSDQPAGEYSIPLFADDTAALMKGLGLSRPMSWVFPWEALSLKNWPLTTRKWFKG